MRPRACAVLVAVLAVSGCAPAHVDLPQVAAPKFPDYVRPSVPPGLASGVAIEHEDRAWQFLQAGDIKNADREVSMALKAVPAFYPGETTAGYLALAQRAPRPAIAWFDRALGRRGDYAPALAGKGQALLALNRESEAIAAFEAALASDPSLADLARRIEVMRFQVVGNDIAAARQAVASGKRDEAARAYRTAINRSPDTPFLYRELAALERDMGNAEGALEDFRKAVALDPSDANSLAHVGELLEARGDVEGALKAYADSLAIEPDAGVESKRNALRARDEMARLPSEYAALGAAAQITRGDLAAIVGVRLQSLLPLTPARDVGVITDIRGHWAESWILAVTRAGVLDPFADHTFQPRAPVSRVDFAQAVTKLLAKVAVAVPDQAPRWNNARGRFTDIGTTHLAYAAASTAIAAGVMSATPDGAFQPGGSVSGAEAALAIERLRTLARLGTDAAPRR